MNVAVLTSGSRGGSASASDTSAAFVPPPSSLVMVALCTVGSPYPPDVPSASQANNPGLTYSTRDHTDANDAGFGDGFTLFYCSVGAAGASGALTFQYGTAGPQGTAAWWIVYALTGSRRDGANGVGAFGTPGGSTAVSSNYLFTLGAFATPDSVAFGFCYHASEELTTPGSGFTEDMDVIVAGGGTFHAEHKTNDNTVDASWATASTRLTYATEIRAARSLAPPSPRLRRPLMRRPRGRVLARP